MRCKVTAKCLGSLSTTYISLISIKSIPHTFTGPLPWAFGIGLLKNGHLVELPTIHGQTIHVHGEVGQWILQRRAGDKGFFRGRDEQAMVWSLKTGSFVCKVINPT